MGEGKPLLFLDVDGVLNPWAAETCPEGFREFAFFPHEEAVRLCEAHGEWLRELTQSFDLVWATGWGEEAYRLISPVLGLPEFPAIVLPSVPFVPAEKVRAVSAFAGDRPLAWIDDMITQEAERWAARRRAPTLHVRIDPAVGLTAAAVEEVKIWAAGLG